MNTINLLATAGRFSSEFSQGFSHSYRRDNNAYIRIVGIKWISTYKINAWLRIFNKCQQLKVKVKPCLEGGGRVGTASHRLKVGSELASHVFYGKF